MLGVVDLVGLRIVTVAPQAIPQDDGVDAVVVEERDEIGGLAADVQSVVPAARRQDHGSAGIEAAVNCVDFDRRVVNVDDTADSPGRGLAHVVLLGFADARLIEIRRVGRIKGDHNAAGQDRRRGIRCVRYRPWLRYSERGGDRSESRARSGSSLLRSVLRTCADHDQRQ